MEALSFRFPGLLPLLLAARQTLFPRRLPSHVWALLLFGPAFRPYHDLIAHCSFGLDSDSSPEQSATPLESEEQRLRFLGSVEPVSLAWLPRQEQGHSVRPPGVVFYNVAAVRPDLHLVRVVR